MTIAAEVTSNAALIVLGYYMGEGYIDALAVGDTYPGVRPIADAIFGAGSPASNGFVSGALDRMKATRVQIWSPQDSLRISEIVRAA